VTLCTSPNSAGAERRHEEAARTNEVLCCLRVALGGPRSKTEAVREAEERPTDRPETRQCAGAEGQLAVCETVGRSRVTERPCAVLATPGGAADSARTSAKSDVGELCASPATPRRAADLERASATLVVDEPRTAPATPRGAADSECVLATTSKRGEKLPVWPRADVSD